MKLQTKGDRFGKLTVIEQAGSKRSAGGYSRGVMYYCECDCGKKLEVLGARLRNGHTRSCGCLKKENGKEVLKVINSTKRKLCDISIITSYRPMFLCER